MKQFHSSQLHNIAETENPSPLGERLGLAVQLKLLTLLHRPFEHATRSPCEDDIAGDGKSMGMYVRQTSVFLSQRHLRARRLVVTLLRQRELPEEIPNLISCIYVVVSDSISVRWHWQCSRPSVSAVYEFE